MLVFETSFVEFTRLITGDKSKPVSYFNLFKKKDNYYLIFQQGNYIFLSLFLGIIYQNLL